MTNVEQSRRQESVGTRDDDLRQLCIETLFASTEERVYFKDRMGRRILASAGSLAGIAAGGRPEDAIGKTNHDLFEDEFADAEMDAALPFGIQNSKAIPFDAVQTSVAVCRMDG